MLVFVIFNGLLQLHPHEVVLPLGYQIQKTPIKDGGYNFLQGYYKAQWFKAPKGLEKKLTDGKWSNLLRPTITPARGFYANIG